MRVRDVRADFGRRTLGASHVVDATSLAELFLNDLKHVPGSLIIAIDGAEHFAEDRFFATFFETLVAGLPSDVRVLLAGRSLPPIPLAAMLVRNNGVAIPAAVLSFTFDEIGETFSAETAERVFRETGGWAAGVSLALRAGTGDSAVRYLAESLVPQLDEGTLSFLENIAIFERVDPRVLYQEPSYGDIARSISALERAGAPMSRDDGGLRIHPLLRELALERLSAAGGLPSAHARASRAYAASHNMAAALFHASASNDEATIDAFLREHAESVVRLGNQGAVAKALTLLRSPATQDVRTYVAGLLGKDSAASDVEQYFTKAANSSDTHIAFAARAALEERRIGRTWSSDASRLEDLRNRADALTSIERARVAMLDGWSHAVAFDFDGAIAAVTPLLHLPDPTARFNSAILHAYAQTCNGEADAALAELDELVRQLENDDRVVLLALTLVWQTRIALLLGRTTFAAESGRAAQRLIANFPLRAEQAALYSALTEIAAAEGNVADSLRYAESTRSLSTHAWYAGDAQRGKALAEITLARTAFLGGDVANAIHLAQRASSVTSYPSAQRALAYSEAAGYAGLKDIASSHAFSNAARECMVEAVAHDAADAVALATASDLLDFLGALGGWNETTTPPPALQPFAKLLETRRGLVTPVHAANTLANARRGGTTFEPFDHAMQQMSRNGDRFELRLMRAYGAPIAPSVERAASADFDLTARESEILTLLVEGLANKEIAQRLVLSPRTVETHVERVLGKLEVGSRSRAIAKALRLGLVILE